jgi:hypothetical protein
MRRETMYRLLLILSLLLLVSCGGPQPYSPSSVSEPNVASNSGQELEPTQAPEVMQEAVEEPTQTPRPKPTNTRVATATKAATFTLVPTNTPQVVSEAVQVEARQPYYPLKDCAASRLYLRDRVYVSYGGGPNGIRTEPDVHPKDNIISREPPGAGMVIISGPACSYGWILWQVETDSGYVGWTPESDGTEFWLIPVEATAQVASEINTEEEKQVYEEATRIMSDNTITPQEKQERMRVLQRNYGEELVTTVMRYVPVYDSQRGQFISFDRYMREFQSEMGSPQSGAPMDRDPIGSAMKIFFDPSPETINEMFGLDSDN